MNIPVAIPSQVSQWVLPFIASLEGHYSLPFVLLETGFYASLRSKTSSVNMNAIRAFSFNYFKNIQRFFSVVNTAFLAFSAVKLIDAFSHSASPSFLRTGYDTKTCYQIASVFFAASYVFGFFLLRKMMPTKKESVGNINVSQEPAVWFHNRLVYLAQLTVNIASIFIERNYFWLALRTLTTGYCFYKATRLSWLSYSKKFEFNEPRAGVGFDYTQSEVKYSILCVAERTNRKFNECSLCFDKKPNVSFCLYHDAHKRCVTPFIGPWLDSIGESAQPERIEDVDNMHPHRRVSYRATFREDYLPKCPQCDELPIKNEISLTFKDVSRFNRSPWVNILFNRQYSLQPIFERVHALYTILFAAFSSLLKYPELAPKFFSIQKFSLVPNGLWLGMTQYYLLRNILELGERKKKVIMFVGMIALPIISLLVSSKISSMMQPTFSLQKIFKALPISEHAAKTMELSWGCGSSSVMQFIMTYQILSTLALSYFSRKRVYSFISALAQSFSLFRVSSLALITLTYRLNNPLGYIRDQGGSLSYTLGTSDLTKLTTKFSFLTYSECTSNKDHLKWTVDSIYTSVNNFFKGSKWSRHIETHYDKDGRETGETMVYGVSIVNRVIKACACQLTPYLYEIYSMAIDPRNPSTRVNYFNAYPTLV